MKRFYIEDKHDLSRTPRLVAAGGRRGLGEVARIDPRGHVIVDPERLVSAIIALEGILHINKLIND